VLIGAVPNFLCDRAAVVQFHTHALFLRTLTSEDIRSGGLLNLGFSKKNLIFSLLVANLNLDDLATRNHTNVLELDIQHIIRQHHANQVDVVAPHATDVVLGSPGLDQASDGSTGVHAVGDGAGQVGVAGKDTGYVNGVVVARHAGIVLVRRGRLQAERSLAVQRNGVLEDDRLVDSGTVALQVV
jgi:hypothetical protein